MMEQERKITELQRKIENNEDRMSKMKESSEKM
jgi:hypothetical protein